MHVHYECTLTYIYTARSRFHGCDTHASTCTPHLCTRARAHTHTHRERETKTQTQTQTHTTPTPHLVAVSEFVRGVVVQHLPTTQQESRHTQSRSQTTKHVCFAFPYVHPVPQRMSTRSFSHYTRKKCTLRVHLQFDEGGLDVADVHPQAAEQLIELARAVLGKHDHIEGGCTCTRARLRCVGCPRAVL